MSGMIEKRGLKMGMPSWAGFLFGGVFVVVGVCIVLVGEKIIPVKSGSVHAPYWVLTVSGASFVLGGFLAWGTAWVQFAAERSRQAAMRLHPGESALIDYPWHPEGFEVSEWTGAARNFGWAVGLTVFLSIFNWWAFVANGPWMVKGIVGIFDLVTVWVWVQAVLQLLRAFKFGHSRIDFTPFPYPLTQPVVIRWKPDHGVGQINSGTFTLRCVQEWTETRGTGKNQDTVLVHEEIWSAAWILEQSRQLSINDPIQLRYDLPADALPTQLSADRPVFWELEVKLNLPGVDFRESYLVPVYR